MKKNKIITLILALSVCTSLILSLCSFTTTTDREFDTFEPLGYTVDVHYDYHRVTSTLDEYYYGVIPSFNRSLYQYGGVTPKSFASDYLMSGSASLDYGTPEFIFSGTDFADSYYSLSADKPATTSILGIIELNGLFRASDVQDYLELIDTEGIIYNFASPDYFLLSGSGYYIDSDNNVGTFNNVLCDNINLTGLNVPNNEYIGSVKGFITNWYNYNEQFDNGIGNIYFTNFKMQFSMTKVFKTIKYRCPLYNSSLRASHFGNCLETLGLSIGYSPGFDAGFAEGSADGYNEGLNDGFNQGVNQAPSIWGSFSSFLTNTVSGFFDFEIVPGFSIGGIVSAMLGITLVVLFLKIFAGG